MAKVKNYVCLECDKRTASRVCARCGMPLCQKCFDAGEGLCTPCIVDGVFFVIGDLSGDAPGGCR